MVLARCVFAIAALSVADADCCGNALGGTCDDGTAGSPCCGVGKCNVFCCNCDGGCRQKPGPSPPAPPPVSSVPLNEWPMIMTHDSATSYYSSNACESIASEVGNYVMTQSPGQFSDQLNSGARAFDFRPYMKDGSLVMHHGSIAVNIAVRDGLQNIKDWSAANSGELVLVYGSHCDGKSDSDKSGCQGAFTQALSDAGIPLIQCNDIAGMTVGDALSKGSVIATWGCVEENYDASIKCYGDIVAENSTDARRRLGNTFVCYGSNADKAFNALWQSIEVLANADEAPHKGEGTLWMAQAHWQYDGSSVAQGVLHGSCILEDEYKANVNGQLADKIKAGDFKHVNLLEVDNVRNNGNAILAALRSRFNNDVAEVDAELV